MSYEILNYEKKTMKLAGYERVSYEKIRVMKWTYPILSDESEARIWLLEKF